MRRALRATLVDLAGPAMIRMRVAPAGARQAGYLLHRVESQEARHRRAHVLLREVVQGRALSQQGDGHQPGRAPALDEVDQPVELSPAVAGAPGGGEALDDAAAVQYRPEDAELGPAGRLRQVGHLQPEAQVRLVGAVVGHRLGVGEPGKRRQQPLFRVFRLHERRVQLLDQVEHVVLLHEAHLQVELRVLRLSVRPRVFVAEAPCDLEILVHAARHQ